MWLVAGLGNPGPSYARHRHNAGFQLLDRIADDYRVPSWRQKHKSEISEWVLQDEKILLCKPQTFMNKSGDAVAAVAQFYQIPPERILVAHDELDLLPAKIRIKQGGGHGGHNGLRDIDRHLGKDYWRLRIGIGHPGDKNLVHNYVLHDFGKEEAAAMHRLYETISAELPLFITQGHEALMSKVALRLQPPKEKTLKEITEPKAKKPKERKEANGL